MLTWSSPHGTMLPRTSGTTKIPQVTNSPHVGYEMRRLRPDVWGSRLDSYHIVLF